MSDGPKSIQRSKKLVIIAGPNGAVKTTVAKRLIPSGMGIREFVNADEIARGLSPFNPDGSAVAAARLMIRRIENLANSGESFAFETTCSGKTYLRLIDKCRKAGYLISILYLWLPTPLQAIKRVARRVREGGHFVPDKIVTRRYYAGLKNLQRLYLPRADLGLIYDNSDLKPALIAEYRQGIVRRIADRRRWQSIQKYS